MWFLRLLKTAVKLGKKVGKSALKKSVKKITFKSLRGSLKTLKKNPKKFLKNKIKQKLKNKTRYSSEYKNRKKTHNITDLNKLPKKHTGKVKNAWQMSEVVNPLTQRGKLIEKIKIKSSLVEEMEHGVDQMLAGKSSYVPNQIKMVKKMNKTPEILKTFDDQQLSDINKLLNEKLEEFKVDMKDDEVYPPKEWEDKEEFYNDIKETAYERYMDSYKDKFFASDDVMWDGELLTQEDKIDKWDEIENERSFSWFTEKMEL